MAVAAAPPGAAMTLPGDSTWVALLARVGYRSHTHIHTHTHTLMHIHPHTSPLIYTSAHTHILIHTHTLIVTNTSPIFSLTIQTTHTHS